VEDEEALQTGALVSQLADSVQDQVDDFLADGVVAASVVVGGVLLARDQLLGVEQLAVGAGADLICTGERPEKSQDNVFKLNSETESNILLSLRSTCSF
jgi:hypothetical protein